MLFYFSRLVIKTQLKTFLHLKDLTIYLFAQVKHLYFCNSLHFFAHIFLLAHIILFVFCTWDFFDAFHLFIQKIGQTWNWIELNWEQTASMLILNRNKLSIKLQCWALNNVECIAQSIIKSLTKITCLWNFV